MDTTRTYETSGKKHIIIHDVIIQNTTTEEAAPSKPRQSAF